MICFSISYTQETQRFIEVIFTIDLIDPALFSC